MLDPNYYRRCWIIYLTGNCRGIIRSAAIDRHAPVARYIQSARFSAVFHGCSRFAISLFAALRLAFVDQLLAPGYADLDFYSASFQIYAERYQRQPLFLCLSNELSNFPLMQQQLPGPCRIVILAVAMRIRADVAVEQKSFASLYHCMAVLQVQPAFSNSLHFRAKQANAGFEIFENKVIVKGFFICGDNFLAA